MATDARLARVHLELLDGFRFNATFPDVVGGAAMTLDETPPLGDGTGPNPAALLASAIGGCLGASLVFCLQKAHAATSHLSADVFAHIERNEAGRFRVSGVDVQLSVDVDQDDAARLKRCEDLFQDFCIVTESVRHGIPVNVNVVKRLTEPVSEG